MPDTTDSAGGASDTQLFAEAPRPSAPRAFRDAGESRHSEEIAHCLLSTQPQESRTHEGAAILATPTSEGWPDEWAGDDSHSGSNDAPPNLLEYGDFCRLYTRMGTATPRYAAPPKSRRPCLPYALARLYPEVQEAQSTMHAADGPFAMARISQVSPLTFTAYRETAISEGWYLLLFQTSR